MIEDETAYQSGEDISILTLSQAIKPCRGMSTEEKLMINKNIIVMR
ncbi:hypothetical protein NOX22_02300 [Enterobacter cloacae]|nr:MULTISPECIES: hypothetical protein [Enterobacter cloacae complex]MCQ4443433.1 hypothetical protein [Enterobacter cloacae]MDW2867105.1 hypothetical protein [Enterobacter hormaechei]